MGRGDNIFVVVSSVYLRLQHPRGYPCNGLQREAAPKRGTFVLLQVYRRGGISQVEVNEKVGKSVILIPTIVG